MSNPHENWEVEVTFRVTGRGRVGADGLVRLKFHLLFVSWCFYQLAAFVASPQGVM